MFTKSILTFVILLFTIRAINAKRAKRIFNGYDVGVDEYPFMVGILIENKLICGGSIIEETHILTAAHCFIDLPPQVMAGIKIRSGSLFFHSGGQVHSVKRVIYHREYRIGDITSPNDIAIVELKDRLKLDDHRKIISLPYKSFGTGEIATAIGWGHTESRHETNSKLRQVALTIMDPFACQSYIPFTLYTHQICGVGFNHQGVCVGDSGGPLVWNRQLIGIVSYGLPCANGPPDVFTSVHHYVDWITEIIGV